MTIAICRYLRGTARMNLITTRYLVIGSFRSCRLLTIVVRSNQNHQSTDHHGNIAPRTRGGGLAPWPPACARSPCGAFLECLTLPCCCPCRQACAPSLAGPCERPRHHRPVVTVVISELDGLPKALRGAARASPSPSRLSL